MITDDDRRAFKRAELRRAQELSGELAGLVHPAIDPRAEVEARWDALRDDMNDMRGAATTVVREIAVDGYFAHHRPLIEDAILARPAPPSEQREQIENEELLRRLDEWSLATRGNQASPGPLIRWAAAHLRGCIAFARPAPPSEEPVRLGCGCLVEDHENTMEAMRAAHPEITWPTDDGLAHYYWVSDHGVADGGSVPDRDHGWEAYKDAFPAGKNIVESPAEPSAE